LFGHAFLAALILIASLSAAPILFKTIKFF
jgi:hypothetical protein